MIDGARVAVVAVRVAGTRRRQRDVGPPADGPLHRAGAGEREAQGVRPRLQRAGGDREVVSRPGRAGQRTECPAGQVGTGDRPGTDADVDGRRAALRLCRVATENEIRRQRVHARQGLLANRWRLPHDPRDRRPAVAPGPGVVRQPHPRSVQRQLERPADRGGVEDQVPFERQRVPGGPHVQAGVGTAGGRIDRIARERHADAVRISRAGAGDLLETRGRRTAAARPERRVLRGRRERRDESVNRDVQSISRQPQHVRPAGHIGAALPGVRRIDGHTTASNEALKRIALRRPGVVVVHQHRAGDARAGDRRRRLHRVLADARDRKDDGRRRARLGRARTQGQAH